MAANKSDLNKTDFIPVFANRGGSSITDYELYRSLIRRFETVPENILENKDAFI